MSLANGLSILFILSKNQLLALLIFAMVSFVSFAYISALILTTDWFQIGKGVRQGCILSPCLFNLYAEHSMRNTGLEEAQAGITSWNQDLGELSMNSDMQMTPPLWQKVKKN